MPQTVLFSARPEMWPRYQPVLNAAFEGQKIDVTLINETTSPELVDYMIYAPARNDDDLSVYTGVKLIQSLWAGPDKLLRNPTLTQPLARMVDPGMTQGMIDYVMGHILRHHLNINACVRAKPGEWLAEIIPPLANQRLVAFLGIGELGLACAKAAREHGFNVAGWSRTPKDIDDMACYCGDDGLADLLGCADIVVTLLPATPATENLLNERRIAQMKKGAFLINPGRGELIDDSALLDALNSGQVGGATLDVFRVEPLPADDPYWAHPNVLVTPHIASETRIFTACQVVADNIARSMRGEPVQYLVDMGLRY